MNFGPPIIDWSPIASLGKTFLGAYDQAVRRRQEAETRGLIDRTTASMGQGAPPQEMRPIASLGEPPAQQPMQGKASTFAAMEGAEPGRTLENMFGERERQYALPAGYLSRAAAIESRFDPNARNPNSSAGGLFQFTDGTAKQYGLSNKFDPAASTDAAARLAADNRAYLSKALGREPTTNELYLAHQQGAGRAVKLLSNPNARAADVLGAKAVVLNGGNEAMTAGEFAQKWASEIGNGNPADLPAQGGRNAQFIIPEGGGMPAAARAAAQPVNGSGAPGPNAGMIPLTSGKPDGPTEVMRNEMAKQGRAVADLNASLDNYNALVKRYGAEALNTEGKARLTAAYTDALLKMKGVADLGVRNGPDLDVMRRQLESAALHGWEVLNPLNQWGIEGRVNGQVDEIKKSANRLLENTRRSYGGSAQQPNPQPAHQRQAPPQLSAPPATAVEFLKQNPALQQQFDEKYGPGAAARALGIPHA